MEDKGERLPAPQTDIDMWIKTNCDRPSGPARHPVHLEPMDYVEDMRSGPGSMRSTEPPPYRGSQLYSVIPLEPQILSFAASADGGGARGPVLSKALPHRQCVTHDCVPAGYR